VIEQLTRHLPDMALDQPQEFSYASNLSFRGPSTLWVHWAPQTRYVGQE
jgi:hypothetical protein